MQNGGSSEVLLHLMMYRRTYKSWNESDDSNSYYEPLHLVEDCYQKWVASPGARARHLSNEASPGWFPLDVSNVRADMTAAR